MPTWQCVPCALGIGWFGLRMLASVYNRMFADLE